MRNPRLLVPGAIHFITFRTEEGLPFMPLPFINMLICSALARAQKLYPVKIICFVVQANHVHMLIRVCDPQIVSRFIGYFKAESANYLNRLLNRRQRTVWEERFDSPIVLDLDKALQIFAYCSLTRSKTDWSTPCRNIQELLHIATSWNAVISSRRNPYQEAKSPLSKIHIALNEKTTG